MPLKTSFPSEWDKQAANWDKGIHSPKWPLNTLRTWTELGSSEDANEAKSNLLCPRLVSYGF